MSKIDTVTISLDKYHEFLAIEKVLTEKGSTMVRDFSYGSFSLQVWGDDELVKKITAINEDVILSARNLDIENNILKRKLRQTEDNVSALDQELANLKIILMDNQELTKQMHESNNSLKTPRPNTTSHNGRYEPKEKTNLLKRLFNL